MKKKLKLAELSVKSFLTEVGSQANLKAGADPTKSREFITCGFLECVVTTEGNRCTTGLTTP